MFSIAETQIITVSRDIPTQNHVEIGPSKHAGNALAGAFPLVDKIVINEAPTNADFTRFLDLYASLGARVQKQPSTRTTVVDNTNLLLADPDPLKTRQVRASILLLSATLLRTGRLTMPIPEGDWPGTRPTSSTIEVAKNFGADVQVSGGMIRAKLAHPKKRKQTIDVHGKVFATFASMILGTGIGGETIIDNPLSSLEVNSLAELLCQMGAQVSGLDSNQIRIQSDGITKLSQSVEVVVPPDACETMFWLAYAKLHNMYLKLIFPNWTIPVTLQHWGPLFDMRGFVQRTHSLIGGECTNAIIYPQDLTQLEPVDITHFHDKFGLPRDAAPVLAVLFGALNAISSYRDDKYGDRRVVWMRELNKVGGRVEFYNRSDPFKATIIGNEMYGYQPSTKHPILNGHDIRSAAALLLAASTSETPVSVSGLQHISRSYTKLAEKMALLGTKIHYMNATHSH